MQYPALRSAMRGAHTLHWLLADLHALFSTSWITWLDIVNDKAARQERARSKISFLNFHFCQKMGFFTSSSAVPCNTGPADTAPQKHFEKRDFAQLYCILYSYFVFVFCILYFDPSFTRSRDRLAGSPGCQLWSQERQIGPESRASRLPNQLWSSTLNRINEIQLTMSEKYSWHNQRNTVDNTVKHY